jgi:hypothetical protein
MMIICERIGGLGKAVVMVCIKVMTKICLEEL